MGQVERVVFVAFIVISCLQREACTAPRCSSGGNNSVPPSDCKYGTTRDTCNNVVCAKGPGQACTAGYWQRDLCVAGTYCATCGRCLGCANNMECVFLCSAAHTNAVYG
ncbi:hypothetical protein Pmani_019636 [Petrolisthes manimaculis]|uniref:Neuroparsin n=1 Tax=Petrolisthes manimaculis TaxID=1843537 RepID=A0AAE1PHA8_9EUCA|nr:hypothetical protein Pmani_019636 [Petrolisthes manimaculis]